MEIHLRIRGWEICNELQRTWWCGSTCRIDDAQTATIREIQSEMKRPQPSAEAQTPKDE